MTYDSMIILGSGLPWETSIAEVDDKAAAGLSWIYRQASLSGQRMFLSGGGADEIISDYGSKGVAFESWIALSIWKCPEIGRRLNHPIS